MQKLFRRLKQKKLNVPRIGQKEAQETNGSVVQMSQKLVFLYLILFIIYFKIFFHEKHRFLKMNFQ